MKMTLPQTKLVGLTMQLELKAKEYNQLCKDIEILKATNSKNSEDFETILKLLEKT